MASLNYYERLGIAHDADVASIKRAYRQLALQYHPDTRPDNDDAVQQFREITEAYKTLINTETRAVYDRTLQKQSAMLDDANEKGQQSSAPAHSNPTHEQATQRMYVITDDKTHIAIRWIFAGALVTLFVIMAQIFLFLDSPTPNLIDRSTQMPTGEGSLQPTGTPLPELLREVVPMPNRTLISERAFAACTIDFVRQRNTESCAALNAIEVISDFESDSDSIVLQFVVQEDVQIVFEIEYDAAPTGWTINIGNSRYNNGTQGDGQRRTADAQISVFEQDMLVYGNEDSDNTQLTRIQDVLLNHDALLYVQVEPSKMIWVSNGFAEQLTSRYLFASAGSDVATVTYYAAFNRTISAVRTRTGSGVSRVRIWLLR